MNLRFKVVIIFISVLIFLIIGRLFELQVLNHNFLGSTVYQKKTEQELIPADRGRIFISEQEKLFPLAINVNTYDLVVSPYEILESDIRVEEWLEKISPFLDFLNWEKIIEQSLIEENKSVEDFKNLLTRISKKDDFYEVLKKDLTIEEVREIQNLNLPGIRFKKNIKRYYPEKELFGHITGFFRSLENCEAENCFNGEGQYGLEEFFHEQLSGKYGYTTQEKVKSVTSLTNSFSKFPENGIDLILTLNRTIQFFVCQTLENALQEYAAKSGSIIVLNPKTGEILALCNYPNFDPNEYSKVEDYSIFKNDAISSAFEPGSIFKVITIASALDAKKIKPETVYLDPGKITIDGETISNVENRTFGYQTMTGVLEKSINTGAVYVAQKIGKSNFRNYLKKFGFGSLTQVELPNESPGNISNLDEKEEIYLATASFGQGITVTSLQMVNAVGAIANQGKLMKPYLIKKIIKGRDKTTLKPNFIRQVISPSAASNLTAMLVSVCENGYGRKAKVPGYYVGGKTGTAQVPKKQGGGYSEEVIHSFVGFAPATNPVFVGLVKIDNPQKGKYADSTAAPTFGKIAEFILNYYNIPPDKEFSQ